MLRHYHAEWHEPCHHPGKTLSADKDQGNTGGRHILLILKECFIDNMTFSPEANVLYRLQQLPTVNYYIRYLDETYHSSLKAKIAFILRSFSSTLEAAYRKYTYIGKSFGTENGQKKTRSQHMLT